MNFLLILPTNDYSVVLQFTRFYLFCMRNGIFKTGNMVVQVVWIFIRLSYFSTL